MTEQLGDALGYPACCIEAFSESARYGSDPVIQGYKDESVIAWPLNVSLSCFGWTCLSHFPCSETCNASFDLARSHFEAIYLCNDVYARTLAARLGTTVIHSRALGVASTYAQDTGGVLECRGVALADPSSPLAVALQPGAELEYLATGARRIGSLTLPKEDARIFRFH